MQAASDGGHGEIVQMLLGRGADVKERMLLRDSVSDWNLGRRPTTA